MTNRAAGSPPIPSFGPYGPDVEYTLSREFRRPALRRFVLMSAITVICAFGWRALAFVGLVTGPFAVMFGVTYVWQGRFRTRLTGRGIEIRGYFNHFVPWRDVRAIEVGGYGPANMPLDASYHTARYVRSNIRTGPIMVKGGGTSDRMARLATIKVLRANGSRLTLPAPRVTGWASDSGFNDKAKQLQQLAQQYAGLTGQPPNSA
jgi:hypothetical protein